MYGVLKILSWFVVLVIVIFCVGNILHAQTTGKIVGRVIDASSGEPMAGANVIVDGTTLGDNLTRR